MSLSSLRTVVIFGSTGIQGGSILRSLLQTNKYKIRAITRDPNSEKAKKLVNDHVEVAKANLYDENDLKNVLKDAWAVFGVTNFYEPEVLQNHSLEIQQGKNLVDAAEAAGVKYLIWSSLPSPKIESKGKYNVPHFDQKYEVEKYAKTKSHLKSIYFMPPFYMQNFQNLPGAVNKDANGTIQFFAPIDGDAKLSMFDVENTGAIVSKLLEDPDKWVDKDIASAGDHISMNQVAETFTKVTGKKAQYIRVPEEQFLASMGPLGPEFLAMYQWFQEFGYYGTRSPFVARDEVHVPMASFEKWLTTSKWTGPQ